MSYSVKIIADSSCRGVRLTTFEIVIPRFILAEFNTHRMFSRNSASSRAIPVMNRIKQIRENPFVPEAFLKNQKGMVAGGLLDDDTQQESRRIWLEACEDACRHAELLAAAGVHKHDGHRKLPQPAPASRRAA